MCVAVVAVHCVNITAGAVAEACNNWEAEFVFLGQVEFVDLEDTCTVAVTLEQQLGAIWMPEGIDVSQQGCW